MVVRPLEGLNFVMADMQADIGPLFERLSTRGRLTERMDRVVMTTGGIAGMVMTTPSDALVDDTSRKRLYATVPGVFTEALAEPSLLPPFCNAVAGFAENGPGKR